MPNSPPPSSTNQPLERAAQADPEPGDPGVQADLSQIPAATTPLWRRVLPFVLGGALLFWVLRRTSLTQLKDAFQQTNYLAFFAFTLGSMLASLAADCFATAYVYRRTVCPVTFREFFVVRGASYLPSMLNHNLGQAWLTYYISKHYQAPLWRVAGATLLVYGTNLAGLVLLGLIALWFNHGKVAWLAPTVGVALLGGLAYFAMLSWGKRWLARWQATAPLVEIGISGHLKAIAIRIPHVLVLFLSTWLCFAFFGVWVPLKDALALVPVLMLVAALPLTPGAVGTRDSVALELFAPFAPDAYGVSAITAATLSWFIMMNLSAALISPPLMRRASRMLRERPAEPAPSGAL